MVDPDDELTDVRMPEQRTDGHVHAAGRRVPGGAGRGRHGSSCLRSSGGRHRRTRAYWRKGVTDPGAESNCSRSRWRSSPSLRLIEADIEVTRDGTGTVIRSRPAIARFALAEHTIREPGSLPEARPERTRLERRRPMLPAPSSERWKPLRAGLVVHVLLRPGGVLVPRRPSATARQQRNRQVQGARPHAAVPARRDLAPHRVEPDGDRQKRMEWNLLLGGKHPSPRTPRLHPGWSSAAGAPTAPRSFARSAAG